MVGSYSTEDILASLLKMLTVASRLMKDFQETVLIHFESLSENRRWLTYSNRAEQATQFDGREIVTPERHLNDTFPKHWQKLASS